MRFRQPAVLCAAVSVAVCGSPASEPRQATESPDTPVSRSDTISTAAPAADPCAATREHPLPRLEVTGDQVRLVLAPDMARILDDHAPGFTPRARSSFHQWVLEDEFGCDEQPSAIVADFNGDGMPDLAALGATSSADLMAILLSDSSGYRYMERDRHERNPGESSSPDPYYYIHRVEPGRYTTRWEPEDTALEKTEDELYVLDLAHAAIGWVYIEKAAGILYWSGDRFRDFATAD